MRIDWTSDFDAMLDRLEEAAARGDVTARTTLDLVLAELSYLQDLDAPPLDETKTLKRVQQSKRYPVWRLAHPFRAGFAVRTIVWFTTDGHAVVALFANNKASMGDIFYSSVGTRADQAIERWLHDTTSEKEQADG